ncbi:MAG: hypothetical protein L6Q49_03370 [Anaerolineales bacterium]|nr:hypothetical protein [Anaerolineales bacterium]
MFSSRAMDNHTKLAGISCSAAMAAYLQMRFMPVQAAAAVAGLLFGRLKSFLTGGNLRLPDGGRIRRQVRER